MFKLAGRVLPADQESFPSFFFHRLDLSSLPVCLESGSEVGAVLSNYVNDTDDLHVKCFIDSNKIDGSIAIQDIKKGTLRFMELDFKYDIRCFNNSYIETRSPVKVVLRKSSMYDDCIITVLKELIDPFKKNCEVCEEISQSLAKKCDRCRGHYCMIHREYIQTISDVLMCLTCATKNGVKEQWSRVIETRSEASKLGEEDVEL